MSPCDWYWPAKFSVRVLEVLTAAFLIVLVFFFFTLWPLRTDPEWQAAEVGFRKDVGQGLW